MLSITEDDMSTTSRDNVTGSATNTTSHASNTTSNIACRHQHALEDANLTPEALPKGQKKDGPSTCGVCEDPLGYKDILSGLYFTFQNVDPISPPKFNKNEYKLPACATCERPSIRDVFDYLFLIFVRTYGVKIVMSRISEIAVLVCNKPSIGDL